MRADIARLRTLERELEQMRRKYSRMVPEQPALYDPMQIAVVSIAGAASECKRAADYLELAIRKEVGG